LHRGILITNLPEPTKVEDRLLYQKMKDFTTASINVLKSLFDEGKVVPVVSRHKFRISGGKFIREKSLSHPSFETFITLHQGELAELTEFRSCIEYCRESTIFREHLSQMMDTKDTSEENIALYLKNEYLFMLLSKLLHSVGGIKYDENEFDKLYLEIESHLASRFVRFLAIAPLKNFECAGREISFAEDIKISPIDSSELNTLINFDLVDAEMVVLHFPPHALKTHFIAEKGIPIDSQIPDGKLQEAIRALRILKKGTLWYDHIYCIPLSWEPPKPLTIFLNRSASGPRYTLEEGEGKRLLQIWKNLNDMKRENRFIEIAVERFDYATLRRRPEDKLTDYIVALEALFLGANEKAELEYRLALRLATLIGESGQERVHIRRILKSAYAQRSSIVHGKKLKIAQINGRKYSTEDLAVALEDYTRKSLQRFIPLATQKINQEELLDRLDDAILDFANKFFTF